MSRPPVDAVLVLSFGGPEGPDDVIPFLENVTRGRNVPRERLEEVALQYEKFGGRSPINEQNRALIGALEKELADAEIDLPIYFGNRNWAPFLADTVATMADDGVKRAAVFVTSAFGSYSGCRQYREDLALAAETVGDRAPELHKLRLYYNHPGFLLPLADRVGEALSAAPEAAMLFTAHSIPESMARSCDYEGQLREAAGIIMDRAGMADRRWDLVYQSRSGPPHIPWLEPDINDHLEALAADGVADVVVLPLGFISDHMEVMFDLDTQAAETAAGLHLGYRRLPTVGTDPRFVAMIRELIAEQIEGAVATPVALGPSGPWPDPCPPDHCLPPQRPGRATAASTG